jgi:hypothetical protein
MKCLKKWGWNIWKLVHQSLHVSLNNLPFILFVVFFIQSFVIYTTDFYKEYYEWFDHIDTVFYIIIALDFLTQLYNYIAYEKLFKYNERNTVCCLVLLALVLLNFCYYNFEMTDYINIYKSVIFGGAIGIILTYIKE